MVNGYPANLQFEQQNFLSDLFAEEMRDLEMSCRWRYFVSDIQIIYQQDDAGEVYFITRSRGQVVSFITGGKEVAPKELGVGDYFRELAAIDGKPRSSQVKEIKEPNITKISPQRFPRVSQRYPQFSLLVI